MKGDLTWDEFLDLMCQDPKFAAEWKASQPQADFELNVFFLREERGMTQRQLAEAAGIKQPRIAEIERGDANPTLTTIIRIAQALGVRVERLFADTSRGRPVLPSAQARNVAPPQSDDVGAPAADSAPAKRSKPKSKAAPAKRSRPARAATT